MYIGAFWRENLVILSPLSVIIWIHSRAILLLRTFTLPSQLEFKLWRAGTLLHVFLPELSRPHIVGTVHLWMEKSTSRVYWRNTLDPHWSWLGNKSCLNLMMSACSSSPYASLFGQDLLDGAAVSRSYNLDVIAAQLGKFSSAVGII